MQESSKNNIDRLSMTAGRIIEKHRKLQRKTVYSISAESSMRKSTWRNVELGADARLSTLWKIAEGLDIDILEIIKEIKQELGSDFTLIDNE